MPVLIITPDITADTGLGAAGCASGSQTWNGTKPAFVPKPTSASRNRPPAEPAGAANAAKSCEPVARPSRKNRASRNAMPTWLATR